VLGDEGGDMLVGLSPRDLPLRWEDIMQNGLETRLHKSNFDFEANTADVARTCGVADVACRRIREFVKNLNFRS
jgi:hypothetical protein